VLAADASRTDGLAQKARHGHGLAPCLYRRHLGHELSLVLLEPSAAGSFFLVSAFN
jgi:hypothetical protein